MLIAFPRQQWLRESASTSGLYVHCPSCWNTSKQYKCVGQSWYVLDIDSTLTALNIVLYKIIRAYRGVAI
jgi:hypothetical protein